ncbi:ABC transporter ATP-binding protein [Euzebya rosea]|uniref:ABC transporter ATP-binding protein n=1 Tax=Euzebya rosea TaxID=2052804 RepID=UPI001300AD63|nr:ABC transporter ATP-binding protein [Euzebya rosea]
MSTEGLAVSTRGLAKDYGPTAALVDVDLAIPTGTTYGLVGPNGAGKSTLLGILAGLRRPSSGTITMEVARQRIAFLPDTPRWDRWLTAFEVVDLARTLTAPHLPVDRVMDTLEVAGLASAAHRRNGGFSRGMLQRLGIAATLVGSPEIVLLDEPSSALDPVGRREVLDLITSMRGTATVVFSSHVLGDVQEICTHIGILSRGRLIAQGPIVDLLAGRAASATQVTLENPADALIVSDRLEQQPWVLHAVADGTTVTVTSDDLVTVRRSLPAVLADAGVPIVAMAPADVTLEDVFLELTR